LLDKGKSFSQRRFSARHIARCQQGFRKLRNKDGVEDM
jgi:hypothetical protein